MRLMLSILFLNAFLFAQADSVLLTLENALSLLIQNNPDVQEAKYTWLAKSELAYLGYGDFEPKLIGRLLKERANKPSALFTETKEEYKLALKGSLPTGTQYDIGFNQTNFQHSDYTSELYFGGEIKQPLLKGFLYFAPINEIKQASAEKQIFFHQFRRTLSEMIEKLEISYWDFCNALQTLSFEKESFEIAKQITEDAFKRFEEGKMSALDQQKAQAEVAIRHSRYLDALGNSKQKQSDLLLLLSSKELFEEKKPFTVHPITDASNTKKMDSSSICDSLKIIHPDYLIQKYELEKKMLNRDFHKSERLPSLNLIGSYGIRSRDDNARAAIKKFKTQKERQNVLSGGIEIEVPLFSGYREKHLIRAENHNIKATQVRLDLITYNLTDAFLTLQERIFNLSKQIQLQKIAVDFHKQELQEELKKLGAGKSTLHLIFEKEEDLRDAEKKELEIIRLFHINEIQLKKAQGTLLIKNGLEVLKNETLYLREDLK